VLSSLGVAAAQLPGGQGGQHERDWLLAPLKPEASIATASKSSASPFRAPQAVRRATRLPVRPPRYLVAIEQGYATAQWITREAYAAKLRSAGVPVTTVRYDVTVHDFMLLNRQSQPADALAATLKRTEIPCGVASGWHTHPGEEVGYIIAGTVQMEIQDHPTLTLNAGDGFRIPPRVPHNATDLGPGTGQMLSTYIVDIGQPIATFTQ
jgi:quercetin dioxygenase-like cupin family protein